MKAVFLSFMSNEMLRLSPGAVESVQLLHAADFKIIEVMPGAALSRKREEFYSLLSQAGIQLSGAYSCLRGDKPELFRRIAGEQSLILRKCWVVGELLDDVESGHCAGCRSILLNQGWEKDWRVSPLRLPLYFARDLLDAARSILVFESMYQRMAS